MTTLLIVFVIAAVVVAGILFVVFAGDARRADQVSSDTDRLDAAPDEHRRSD